VTESSVNGTTGPLAGSPKRSGGLPANAQGFARIGPAPVPATAAITAHLQALDLATCATCNPAQVIH
jgi:hypothetical protein